MTTKMLLMMAALGAELLLLVLAVLFVAWLRSRAAARRDAKAMRALAARIKNGKAEREATISAFLSGRLGMSGEALAQSTRTLLEGELRLLQRFAEVYRDRDAAGAARFDIDAGAAFDPYHETLQGGGAGAGDEAAAVPAEHHDELESLRDENRRLSDEMRLAMETMSRMLSEYSTMFAAENGMAGAAAVATEAAMAEEFVAVEAEAGLVDDAVAAEALEVTDAWGDDESDDLAAGQGEVEAATDVESSVADADTDIDALIEGAAADAAGSTSAATAAMSDADIDDLIDGGADVGHREAVVEVPAASTGGEEGAASMSDADIDDLLASGAGATPTTETPADVVEDADIDALLDAGAHAPVAADDASATTAEDDIDRLLAEAGTATPAAPKATPSAPQEAGDAAEDDVDLLLEASAQSGDEILDEAAVDELFDAIDVEPPAAAVKAGAKDGR